MENISLGIDIFSMIFITFVLLKTLVFIRLISFKRVGYNWTLLELKQEQAREAAKRVKVIIEPYWNWNRYIITLSLHQSWL